MKKGIRSKKLRRKVHNATLIAITVIAAICVLLMPMLFAFVDSNLMYGVVWFLGFAWCVGFTKANGKGCEDVY